MDADTQALIAQHNAHFPGEHDNLQPGECVCKRAIAVVNRPPIMTGSTSACCGAMEQRNGSCMICTSCGSTSACG